METHGINGGFNAQIHGKSSINGGFNRKIMVLPTSTGSVEFWMLFTPFIMSRQFPGMCQNLGARERLWWIFRIVNQPILGQVDDPPNPSRSGYGHPIVAIGRPAQSFATLTGDQENGSHVTHQAGWLTDNLFETQESFDRSPPNKEAPQQGYLDPGRWMH